LEKQAERKILGSVDSSTLQQGLTARVPPGREKGSYGTVIRLTPRCRAGGPDVWTAERSRRAGNSCESSSSQFDVSAGSTRRCRLRKRAGCRMSNPLSGKRESAPANTSVVAAARREPQAGDAPKPCGAADLGQCPGRSSQFFSRGRPVCAFGRCWLDFPLYCFRALRSGPSG